MKASAYTEFRLSFPDSAAPGAIYNPLFFGHQFETLTGSVVATLNGSAVAVEFDDAQFNSHSFVRWFNRIRR